MATREDVQATWVDVARGMFSVPRDKPARVFLERATVGTIEVPVTSAFFQDDGAVLSPEGGVAVLTAAFSFVRDNPGQIGLVLGHCESKTTQAAVMAERRAQGVFKLLGGDLWGQHAAAHHTVADLQRALAWVAATRGLHCDPGPIGGPLAGQTTRALGEFRDIALAEAGVLPGEGPTADEADWSAIRAMIYDAVMEAMGETIIGLANILVGLKLSDPGAVGCGHNWSVEAVDMHDYKPASPVRVDVMLFPDVTPPLVGLEKTPGESVYRERNYACMRLEVSATATSAGGGEEGADASPTGEEETIGFLPLELSPESGGTISLQPVPSSLVPSAAPLTVRYSIEGRIDAARIEIRSSAAGGIVYARPLDREERAQGNHAVKWAGATNTAFGAALGPVVDRTNSPYELCVVYDDGGGDEEKTDVVTFAVES